MDEFQGFGWFPSAGDENHLYISLYTPKQNDVFPSVFAIMEAVQNVRVFYCVFLPPPRPKFLNQVKNWITTIFQLYNLDSLGKDIFTCGDRSRTMDTAMQRINWRPPRRLSR